MKISSKHILAALAFVVAGTAAAQYVGPSGVRLTTVAEVLKSGKNDQQVMLQGVLLKKVGREKYEFSDGTATVRVEIDDKIFPRETIDEKTRVEIVGEFEKDFMTSPEIDVDTIRRLP
ncbi:YgiW/YdeI family stress tolerance OB fold protein [Variovorax sp. M-6]|uniref:YgiW/YdeI family stress tolerance OB fold protein n=1 Tax=Variovorax sp. M-6 TaxID=3233041 RepID=UPI003F96DD32